MFLADSILAAHSCNNTTISRIPGIRLRRNIALVSDIMNGSSQISRERKNYLVMVCLDSPLKYVSLSNKSFSTLDLFFGSRAGNILKMCTSSSGASLLDISVVLTYYKNIYQIVGENINVKHHFCFDLPSF